MKGPGRARQVVESPVPMPALDTSRADHVSERDAASPVRTSSLRSRAARPVRSLFLMLWAVALVARWSS